jgi:hypothetical protein
VGRFMQMMWRLNFFVFFVCLVMRNDYVLYYICPMHTLFTLFVYFSLLLAGLRPTQLHFGIRATHRTDFGRFRTSRIGFGVILPIGRGLFWV